MESISKLQGKNFALFLADPVIQGLYVYYVFIPLQFLDPDEERALEPNKSLP